MNGAATRIAVGAAKGAPGATTFALALALCWPGSQVVLVEADPAGGDLGGRFGVPDLPGLAGLVVQARRDRDPGVWRAHAQRLPVGADVVIAPASGRHATAAVLQLADTALASMRSDVDLILDVGRYWDASPAWRLAESADAVLLVSGAEDAAIDHTAAFTSDSPLRGRLSVVLVGETRFRLPELEAAFGVPVAVTVPVDRRGAAVLCGSARPGRGWTRVGLAAAARTVALALHRLRPAADASEPQPVAPPVLARDGAR